MLEPGTTFAGYVIERALGAGGMGEVYVGRHPRLPRSDALKVLAPQLGSDPQFRARFEREADLAASLSHPAIVKVHDRGESEGRLWIAMELVDGVDLAQRLRETGPFPASEVASVVSTIADALDRAAGRGLVHRDVKPANILLSTDGDVLLTDFGIARMGGEASELTGTGVTVGTVNYASPEQLQGRPLDGRSDQYSLACTAFQLLTGEAPYADSNAAIVIAGHLGLPLPSVRVRRPDLAPQLDEVLARATAKSPDARYASSGEFAAAFAHACAASVPGRTFVVPAVPPSADPDRTFIPGAPVAEHDAPTQLRAANSSARANAIKSHRGFAVAAVAVVAVIALVAGVVVWRSVSSQGLDDSSVSPEAAGLPRVLATPVLGSVARKPSGPKWTYTPASGRAWKAIGGTAAVTLFASSVGMDKDFIDLVSTETGTLINRIAVGKAPDVCDADPQGSVVVCRIRTSTYAKIAVVDLAAGRIKVIDTGLDSPGVPYADGGRFVVSGRKGSLGRNIEVQVYDSDGSQVWRQEMPSAQMLPGAGVVAATITTKSPFGDTTVLSVRRVSDGKEVLRRDNYRRADPDLGGFSGGFAVDSDGGEELYSTDGTRTGAAPAGWSMPLIGREDVDAPVIYRAPSLPVLVQDGTHRVGAFTVRGDQLWSRPGIDSTFSIVGLGTTAVQRSVRDTSKTANPPAYKYSWFDVYSGAWGTFEGGLSNKDTMLLGTDGEHIAYKVHGTNGGDSNSDLAVGGNDENWSLTYTSDQADWASITAYGGRLYAGTSRLV
ncbi:serine/threonine-protein kinase [Tsukamurella sp. DT100]|uniref:serine/threonine-protein kinase n=1 Tax=Tsukamurella sp. DT100 TaxID=3393415 RepID=UPI003CEB1DB0